MLASSHASVLGAERGNMSIGGRTIKNKDSASRSET
jgi:hypothetical protein